MLGHRSTASYLVEIACALAIIYFLLGGYSFPPILWLCVAFFTGMVVFMEVRRESGAISEESYDRWRAGLGVVIVVGLFLAAVWHGSILMFLFAVVVAWFAREDWLRFWR